MCRRQSVGLAYGDGGPFGFARKCIICNEDGMRGRQLRKIACGGFGVDLFLF